MGEPVKLTDDQRKLAEDNHRLALKFANTRRPPIGMDHEEWIAECFYLLVRAARGFNPELGFSFATYAYRAMERGRWAVYKQRKQIRATVTQDPITGKILELDSLEDYREGNLSQIEKLEASQLHAEVDGLVRALPADLRLYMRQRVKGLSFRDMAREWGVSRQALQQRAGHARQAMLRVAEARGIDLS